MTKKVYNSIMRRVYYAYSLRVLSNPTLLHGIGMFAVLLVLTRFVSPQHVLQNIAEIPVGNLGTYFYSAVAHTELWTLLLLGIFIFMLFSFRVQLKGFHLQQA